jgi:hypothetical protein
VERTEFPVCDKPAPAKAASGVATLVVARMESAVDRSHLEPELVAGHEALA